MDQKARKRKLVDLVFGAETKKMDLSGQREKIIKALDQLEHKDRLEKTVLISLRNNPKDYCNAFAAISRNTRYIYIHAYQSHIWNRAVSERLRRFGKKVLLGDLVLKDSKDEDFIDKD